MLEYWFVNKRELSLVTFIVQVQELLRRLKPHIPQAWQDLPACSRSRYSNRFKIY